MNYLLAILAGALQGLTEFLPISSTGHLIIFENIFHISQEKFGLTFDAALHLGTLIAVIGYFYKDYIKFLRDKREMLTKILLATIPAVFFGLLFSTVIETTFRQNFVVAFALILFSPVILIAEYYGKKIKKDESLSYFGALVIGLFQALALIPGISRSGSTISAGLLLGLTRQEAARFAFIISGPIIAGAGVIKLLDVGVQNKPGDLQFFVIGIISSSIFGYFTIKFLIRFLSTNTLIPFVIYRILLGLILLKTQI